jgi:hypothetical protein
MVTVQQSTHHSRQVLVLHSQLAAQQGRATGLAPCCPGKGNSFAILKDTGFLACSIENEGEKTFYREFTRHDNKEESV